MRNGGQIPWNAIPICETFKISCLMGRLHAKDVLENLSQDQSFRLVHWLSITLFLRKTSQESINLERESYLDCSLDTLCTREEFGRVQNFHVSGCPSVANHGSTGHELETLQWRRGRKRAARVLWCHLARSLGFLRNQSGPDEWILQRHPCSCRPSEFRWLSTQTGPGNSQEVHGNLQFTHEHQLFLDSDSHHFGSSGNPAASSYEVCPDSRAVHFS